MVDVVDSFRGIPPVRAAAVASIDTCDTANTRAVDLVDTTDRIAQVVSVADVGLEKCRRYRHLVRQRPGERRLLNSRGMAIPNREGDRRRRKALERIRSTIGTDARRLRLDAGLPLARLAEASGVSRSHLNELELGTADPSLPTLVAIADALGADLSIRLYPNTGSPVRDHIQARIVEELFRIAHPRWRRSTEVPVYRPARGRIDAVLHDPVAAIAVATEVHSQVRRLEQQLGWARLKAESLPSAEFWRFLEAEPTVGQVLVLRSTRATRELARQFESTLRAAYPARSADVFSAVAGEDAWPGNGLLWADVTGGGVRVLDRPPRGVMLGR